MTTAFQVNAFQFGAFQIDVTVSSSYGGRRHTEVTLKKARTALRAAERAEEKATEHRKSELLDLVQRKGAPKAEKRAAKVELVQIEKVRQLPPAVRYVDNEKIARLRAAAEAAETEYDKTLAEVELRTGRASDDLAIVILMFA